MGSNALHITDDPHLVEGLGSRIYDGEGMATRPRPIFEHGILRNYYFDTYYAHKLGLEPTSGSQANLVYQPGKRDLRALCEEMDQGLLITAFIGGNSDDASGDFSFGVRGHLVERGQVTRRAISEMNISGNHLTFWKHLLETGNDPFPYSSNRCPSLRFAKAQFSGA